MVVFAYSSRISNSAGLWKLRSFFSKCHAGAAVVQQAHTGSRAAINRLRKRLDSFSLPLMLRGSGLASGAPRVEMCTISREHYDVTAPRLENTLHDVPCTFEWCFMHVLPPELLCHTGWWLQAVHIRPSAHLGMLRNPHSSAEHTNATTRKLVKNAL